jgi:photosystem II stability/assembly factor-like uncharacterized protein
LAVGVAVLFPTVLLAEPRLPAGELVEVGHGETEFVAVAVAPGRVYAASRRAVHESVDGGRTWQERFRSPGQAEVRALAAEGAEPTRLLVATSHGLYGSFDSGGQWRVVFQAVGKGASDCVTVAFHPAHPDRAALGTRQGLFISSDGGRTWREADLPREARDIAQAAFHPREPARLYVVTAEGLFTGNLVSGSWQRLRTAMHAEEMGVEQPASVVESPETDEEDGSLHRLSAVVPDPAEPSTLYLATSRGVETSEDDGRTWKRLGRSGLASPEVTDLLAWHRSPLALFAATARGVARYEPASDRWVPLTQGRAASRTSDLSAAGGVLWAATEEGLVRFEVPPDTLGAGEPPSPQELLANFSHEPTITQVREVAIRYAEVHPDKIAAWRQQARWRALLPKFSLSGDTNLTDFRHWDSGSNPDALLKGERDIDWSANVTWEPADVIWSDDQTSIDVRSKLMVELRDDIVDEVTRTYFERRRLQVALLTDPPKNQKTLLEKELRVQELTALIDGLTGGYFSAQMQVNGNL